jgi:HSP20 family protein
MKKIAIRPRNRSRSPFFANNLVQDIFKTLENNRQPRSSSRTGSTDIYEQDGTLHYEIELPGYDKEEITVQTKEDRLVVTGESETEEENENRNYLARGRKSSKIKRSYPLPGGIDDAETLSARFKNGVLHVSVPLPEEDERKIEVEID